MQMGKKDWDNYGSLDFQLAEKFIKKIQILFRI